MGKEPARGTRAKHFPADRRERNRAGRSEQLRPVSNTASARTELAPVPSFELRKGPIPDAEELVRYGRAHPDAPAIILSEFQTQAAHRRRLEWRIQEMEMTELEAAIESERLGLACALLIALVGFACGTWLIGSGHGVEGTIVFGLDVVALVSAFILGRSRGEQAPQGEQAVNRVEARPRTSRRTE